MLKIKARQLNIKFLSNEIEKLVKIALPKSKTESSYTIELMSTQENLRIGKKKKALILVDRKESKQQIDDDVIICL